MFAPCSHSYTGKRSGVVQMFVRCEYFFDHRDLRQAEGEAPPFLRRKAERFFVAVDGKDFSADNPVVSRFGTKHGVQGSSQTLSLKRRPGKRRLKEDNRSSKAQRRRLRFESLRRRLRSAK